MKRYGQLWEKLISWENLVLAAHKAQRGKRDRVSVQEFNFELEQRLLKLQSELSRQTYKPGLFRTHWIDAPKRRMISVAPYRDRVVHHAVMNILEPLLDRHFHPDSYACRKEKGTLAAVERLQTLMYRYKYALQCDIYKFFASLDHTVMKTVFRRLFKDKNLLWLLDVIVDHSNPQPSGLQWFKGDDLFSPLEHRKGLPIGNLTSQWFANWYLNGLDHFITSHLGIGAYVRYCDDFILLNNDRGRLQEAREQIESCLTSIRLKLNPKKVFVRPVEQGLLFVGYWQWRTHRFLKKTNIRTLHRRVRWMQKTYACGRIDWPDVRRRLDSWLGYACHADTRYLIKKLSKQWRFQRNRVFYESCYARRQLEQQCIQLRSDQPRQQYTLESQQQHRISTRPAPSGQDVSLPLLAQNYRIYGCCECCLESPDLVPALSENISGGQMIARGPDGTGRRCRASRPVTKRKYV